MKTKFLVVSDIHDYNEQVDEMIEVYEPDVILDCGDHSEDESFYTPKNIPWYFIYGNHENHEKIYNLTYGIEEIKNLHLIKPGDIININGINIAGFGGNYSEKTYNGISKKKANNPFHITQSDVKAMQNMANNKKLVDILLMHESSKELWSDSKFNFGQKVHSNVVGLFDNVKYVISGHYHVPMEKILNNKNNEHYRKEISLNTPENYNFILLEGKNRHVYIKDMQNLPDSNYYEYKSR